LYEGELDYDDYDELKLWIALHYIVMLRGVLSSICLFCFQIS